MTSPSFVHLLSYLEPVLCAMALFALLRSGSARKFPSLVALLAVKFLSSIACLSFVGLAGKGIEKHLAYRLYFYTYWPSFAVEAILSLVVIYSIFKLAMEPLKGLATLGILVFRWAAAISVAISITMAIGPNYTSSSNLLVAIVKQLQQTTNILTLCLLLFVCFAIRPMGLTYKSRIFGISFGLGLLATISLVNAAWLARSEMFSVANIVNGGAVCATFFVWSAYFTLPEPKRRMILLPTTSPFLRWNQISMALGDDPGFVAVGGIPPEIFAPAEIEIMRRASVKMNASRAAISEPEILSRLA